jgi:Flp pilus assembly protein TadD
MAHKYNGLMTAGLVLVAGLAAGCSGSGKKPAAKPEESKPSMPAKAAEPKELGDVSKPVPSGPVTFADGEAAYKARDYAEATRIFARYTDEHPKNVWGPFMLGLSTWKGGDLKGAEAALEQALTIDPKHIKSLVNLSRVLLDENRTEDAIERLTEATEIDPMSTDVPRLLGRAYSAQGKTDEAIAAYRRAIELDAKDCWAMNNLGLIFLGQGHAEDALPLLAKAVEIDKSIPAFHNNLGMALEHTGRFSAAAMAYTKALEADPTYEKAKQNLARVETVKEDPKIAPFEPETTAQVPEVKPDVKVEKAEKVDPGPTEPVVSEQAK